jgi:hypothetical protein
LLAHFHVLLDGCWYSLCGSPIRQA